MMKSKRTILAVGLISVSSILIGLFVYVNFFFGRYLNEIDLEINLVITPDWKEIDVKNLVRIDRDINYLSIILEPSYETFSLNGIKTPSGEIINPEIIVVDENGKEYSLAYSGSRRHRNVEYANYKYGFGLPVDRKYEKVCIRSDVPLKTRKIIWTSYNVKDLP